MIVWILVLTLILSWNHIGFARALASTQSTEGKIISAFQAISSAEKSGGNVTSLANLLNEAATLNDKANSINQSNPQQAQSLYSQASSLASQVSSQAPSVGAQGAVRERNAELVYIGEISLLGALAIFAGIFFPKFFWNYWIKGHKKWVAKKSSALTDTQVQSVLLIIIFIVGLGVSYNYFDAGSVTSPFSNIALLGPNQTLSNYPKNVTANQNFTLYLYLGNQEGHVMYYKVLEELGNASSVLNQTTTISSSAVASYSFILANNESSIRELSLTLKSPGKNVKLAFEMFVYSIPQQNFVYYGQWTQILLNVTSSK